MKKLNILTTCMALILILVMLNACKKASTVDNSVAANDANNISAAIDGIASDAGAAAGQQHNFSGKTTGWAPLLACANAVADSGNGNTITISYDGKTSCDGFYRNGSITVTLLGTTKWAQSGSQLNVVINNMKITTLTGVVYSLSGTYTITNETGGLAWEIVSQAVKNATVRHRVTASDISITFSDGSQRSWSVDRTTSYISVVNGTNTISIYVFSENNAGNDTQGTNRYGQEFTTTIADTISSNNNCSYQPYSGKYVYNQGSIAATILFGTNSSGVQGNSPTTCATGYYLTYSNGSKSLSLYLPYW